VPSSTSVVDTDDIGLCVCAADVNLIMPHVPHIMTFIEDIAADQEHSDAVVGATCGLIGFVPLSLCSCVLYIGLIV